MTKVPSTLTVTLTQDGKGGFDTKFETDPEVISQSPFKHELAAMLEALGITARKLEASINALKLPLN